MENAATSGRAAAIRDDDPVLVFEHKALYTMRGEVPDGDVTIPLGQADIKREGSDVTVIAWARMVHLALGRGGYAVERLDDRRDPYVDRLRERFLFARRMV